ncbi:unnamed protein product [Thlaspi arvense]|uniref:Uncharacterized protein n=1 Tax=Thlaspi arvense TaxID=13288 RepID=A0AAU9RFX8_THLAR|nr:unnamed protein product [Thlaspi arvense]
MHVVLLPWLAFGHMLPYLQLARFLAQGGDKVSFVSTHRNIQRLPKPPPHLSPFIDFVKLALPRVEEIPADAEATVDVRSEDIHYLEKAYDGLGPELGQFLRSYCADWILHDFASLAAAHRGRARNSNSLSIHRGSLVPGLPRLIIDAA